MNKVTCLVNYKENVKSFYHPQQQIEEITVFTEQCCKLVLQAELSLLVKNRCLYNYIQNQKSISQRKTAAKYTEKDVYHQK